MVVVTIDQTNSRLTATLRSCAAYAKRRCWMGDEIVQNSDQDLGSRPKREFCLSMMTR